MTKSKMVRRFLRNRLAIFGIIWLLIVLITAIGAPVIERYSMSEVNLDSRSSPPSKQHWLGTDSIGRDVWSRTVNGARISLLVVAISVTGSVLIGTLIGATSGLSGGVLDTLLQRLTEVFMSLPLLIVALVFMAITSPGLWSLLAALIIFGWTDTARVVRGEMLSVREEEYVEAARALGGSASRILFKHALPACVPSILVNATLKAATFVLAEASLSFLGYGVQPPTPSWGIVLAEAQQMEILTQMPWMWIPPGVAITLTILAFNFAGDGLRDAVSPREKQTVI